MRGLNKIMNMVLEFDRMFEMHDYAYEIAKAADYIEAKRLPAYEARRLFLDVIEPTINHAGPVGALSRRILEVIDDSFHGTTITLGNDFIDMVLTDKPKNPANKNFRNQFDY